MKFKEYINELAMKKGTIIKSPFYKKESMYEQDIVLEDGLVFHFKCYYFKTAGVWEVAFEDQDEKAHQTPKRKGAAIENVFKNFIDTALPNEFSFRSDLEEKSRVKLYDILAKKIIKMGYGYIMIDRKISSVNVIYKFRHKSDPRNKK